MREQMGRKKVSAGIIFAWHEVFLAEDMSYYCVHTAGGRADASPRATVRMHALAAAHFARSRDIAGAWHQAQVGDVCGASGA